VIVRTFGEKKSPGAGTEINGLQRIVPGFRFLVLITRNWRLETKTKGALWLKNRFGEAVSAGQFVMR